MEAGAYGLTAHPRPDERHIRHSDIAKIADLLADFRDKDAEFNIEGYPDRNFLKLIAAQPCDQITLVPDDPNQRTSDHGWDIKANKDLLKDAISQIKETVKSNKGKTRISLFIDPVPEITQDAAEVGASRVELYTGPYAENTTPLKTYVQTAIAAKEAGIEINAGHDLSLDNLARFISKIPNCREVSIGHAITADALKMGWNGAVSAYLTAIEYGQKMARDRAV